MTTTNHPRRLVPASELGLGVRPGAGVLGLSKAEPKAPQEESHSEGTLIVGEGIQVKGEIQSCTTLIVEGKVEASLEAVELAVRDSGHYAGTALVDTARIAGSFSGELTVSGLLTVEAGGRVSGTLRYGELRVEQGGRVSGDIDLLAEAPARRATKPANKPAAERVLEGAATR